MYGLWKFSLFNFRKEKKYIDCCWKDVTVGDFIRLSCNEIIPADMVLLFSTDPDGICHIETSGLDGESNLKQRQVVRGYAEQVNDMFLAGDLSTFFLQKMTEFISTIQIEILKLIFTIDKIEFMKI